MNIADQTRDFLLKEYSDGMKQTEMAKLHDVSQQYICRLLSGKRSCGDITLKTLMKMFPRATLNLNGDGNITQTVSHVNVKNGSVSLNNAPASEAQIKSAVEAFRHEVVDALIGLDIPPDALAAVLKTIKELAQ